MGREILTRMLARKLEEKEDEMREFRASLQEEIQDELQYYDRQLTSMREQMMEMSAAIDGLTRELLDLKGVVSKTGPRESPGDSGSDRGAGGKVDYGDGDVKVLRNRDDAIVMVRRR